MKPWIWVLLWLAVGASQSEAQSNSAPVRLAVVAPEQAVAAELDVLTAELSKKERLQLLERTEIARVYREQGLSAANQNYLKLGQILGADGLLALNLIKEGTNEFLQAQLVAVKPGVVIGDTRAAWPLKDVSGWAALTARHFELLYPKLGVLAQEALPVSIVNLRAAVRSGEEQELEQQLTALLIARLTHEPQLFVLERRRMESLAAEKELKGVGESAFWNGSYLVDAVIDRDGYSKETVTISARLVPPKGGTPVPIEISGSRTNVAEVINRLAEKVMAGLKLAPLNASWNPAEEAAQYFEEAKWAFRWEMFSESRAAADSAWALGKRDMECAMIRIRSNIATPHVAIQYSLINGPGGIGPELLYDGTESNRDYVLREIKQISAAHAGTVFEISVGGIAYKYVDRLPDVKRTERLVDALDLYLEFSRALPPGEPKERSPWHHLGVGVLTSAAEILQHYYLTSKSGQPADETTGRLRFQARSIAEWLASSPAIHDAYFTAAPDPDVIHVSTFYRLPNIFRCEALWGCYWQETPEDCAELYRRLVSSPNFQSCNTEGISPPALGPSREMEHPCLVAWNEQDRKGFPMVWSNLVRELAASTNQWQRAQAKLFESIPLPGLNQAEIIAAYTDYWEGMKSGKLIAVEMAKQRKYFQEDQKFDLGELAQATLYRQYSKEQAQEILPLLSAYRARIAEVIPKRPAWIIGTYTLREVDDFAEQVTRIAKPGLLPVNTREAIDTFPTYKPGTGAETSRPAPESPTSGLLVRTFYPVPTEKIPRDSRFFEQADRYNVEMTGSRWTEDKLALEFNYTCQMHVNGGGGEVHKIAGAVFDPASAGWEVFAYPPSSYEGGYPRWPYFPVPYGLYQSDYYYSEGAQLKRRTAKNGRWEALEVPGLNSSHLYSLEGRLFAANTENILEVTEGGKGAHILASIRRRPVVTTLDSLDRLGIQTWSDGVGSFGDFIPPILFCSPDHSICVINDNRVLAWQQTNNWIEMLKMEITRPPEVLQNGIVFRSQENLWFWDTKQAVPELCWYQRKPPRFQAMPPRSLRGAIIQPAEIPAPKTHWNSTTDEPLLNASVTSFDSNLYFLVDHAIVTNRDPQITEAEKKHETIVGGLELARRSWTIAESDGCHAHLVCLSRDFPDAIVIPIKFDLAQGQPPLTSLGRRIVGGGIMQGNSATTWLNFSGNNLYMGETHALGIWSIPIADVNAAVASQKKLLRAKMASTTPGGKE